MLKVNKPYYGYKVKSVSFGRVVVAKSDGHGGESTADMPVESFVRDFGKQPVPGQPVVS